jgi:hypothetical protein
VREEVDDVNSEVVGEGEADSTGEGVVETGVAEAESLEPGASVVVGSLFWDLDLVVVG